MTPPSVHCRECDCVVPAAPSGKFCGLCGHSASEHELEQQSTLETEANEDAQGDSMDDDSNAEEDSVAHELSADAETSLACSECDCGAFVAPAGRRFCGTCGHGAAAHGAEVRAASAEAAPIDDHRPIGMAPSSRPASHPAPLPSWLLPAGLTALGLVIITVVALAAAGGWRNVRSGQLDDVRDRRQASERAALRDERRAAKAATDLEHAQKNVADASSDRVALSRDIKVLPGQINRLRAREAALRATMRKANQYS